MFCFVTLNFLWGLVRGSQYNYSRFLLLCSQDNFLPRCELATVKSKKADVSSVSPSLEWFESNSITLSSSSECSQGFSCSSLTTADPHFSLQHNNKTVGRLLAVCRPMVDQLSTDGRPIVGRQLAKSRPTVGRQTANSRPTVFIMLQTKVWIGCC